MIELQRLVDVFGEDGALDLLYSIVDQLPLSLLIKDEDLRYQVVNASFCNLLSIDRETMLGKTAAEVFSSDFAEFIEARERHVLESGTASSLFEDATGADDADGARRHYITDMRPLVNGRGDRFISIAKTDVTELNEARREAESAARIKSEFLATMSHELRTPMNGVLGLTQILKETDLTAEQRQLVDTISSSGEGLLAVISDILDFTVIEAGQLRLAHARYEVGPLVEDTVRMMTPAAEAAGVRLFLSAAPNAPACGVGDAARIRQVLTNFIGNAIKFTEAGHIEVRRDSGDGRTLVLSVSDTGVGVAKSDQAAIFERFRQAKGGFERPHQGVGLGLSICKSLAEMMGGDVRLASAPGEGSTFTLSCALDIEEPRAASAAPPATAPVEDRRVGVAKVIDAYAPRARAFEERLAKWGWSVQGSDRGPADVIVMVVDDAPGPWEAAALSNQPHDAPIVFVTPLSRSSGGEEVAALAEGRLSQIVYAPAADGELRAALLRLSAGAEALRGRRAPPERRLRAGQS